MFDLKISLAEAPLTNFLAKYQDVQKFLQYCKECPKYNTRWSCPPMEINTQKLLADYSKIYLLGFQIFFDLKSIEKAIAKDKQQALAWKILRHVKRQAALYLIDVEKQYADTLSFSSGGCDWCCKCTREKNQPCRKPNKMRYSLDSFGIDLTAVTEEFLQIKLLWAKDSLPAYYTLIHALAIKDSVDVKSLQEKLATLSVKDIDTNIDYSPYLIEK